MRTLVFGSLSALLVSAGLAVAEAPSVLPASRTTSSGGDLVAVSPVDGPMVAVGEPVLPSGDCLEGNCGTGYTCWINGDYLLWWYKTNRFPPLLTVGPASSGGVPGRAGVRTIGGDDLDDNQHHGGRITAGTWFTEYRGFGIEGSFFMLESKSYNFGASGTGTAGSTAVGRPFFDLLNGRESVRAVAFPTLASGSALTTTFGECAGSSRLYGAEFNFLLNLCSDCNYRVDLMLGYRYLSLEDKLRIQEDSVNNVGVASTIIDQFDTANRFNGGQIGARAQWQRGRLGLQLTGKVAVGSTDEVVDSVGSTTLFFNAGRLSQNIPAGFLAVPGNSGKNRCEHFSFVPEANARVSFQILECLHAFAGYSFLWWSSVARSGDQVNRNVNLLETPVFVSGVPGSVTRPVVIHTTDFWAHGINAGLELRY